VFFLLSGFSVFLCSDGSIYVSWRENFTANPFFMHRFVTNHSRVSVLSQLSAPAVLTNQIQHNLSSNYVFVETTDRFYPRWYVRTTRVLLCCCCCSCCGDFAGILHFWPISVFTMLSAIAPLHAAVPGSLARQPCPAALSGSLVR
jgi:hypothetical protein